MRMRSRRLQRYLPLLVITILIIILVLVFQLIFRGSYMVNIRESFSAMNIRKDTYLVMNRSARAVLRIRSNLSQGEFRVIVYSPDEKIAYQYNKLRGRDTANIDLTKGNWRLVVSASSARRGSYNIEFKTQ